MISTESMERLEAGLKTGEAFVVVPRRDVIELLRSIREFVDLVEEVVDFTNSMQSANAP